MSKREQTRQKILAAAWHLFEQQGYQETSTRQIARQAGVADGTVFSHFDTKLAILREGMMGQLTTLSQQSELQPTHDALELGMQFARTYYGYYFANLNLSRALLKEVIWDMDYYQSFNRALFDATLLPASVINKMPIILDCYFMTLISHLSKAQPDLQLALEELEFKYRTLLGESQQ
ncbi:TetR/AcrR family transcriptional regulator [Vibrio sinaloensis]|uniref:TetR/AcrR family transcriptional regulator n=1 Tax=Photobacterium sp. (strain ATCC 43367) TaxID=379097 RepID=UPI0035E8F24A